VVVGFCLGVGCVFRRFAGRASTSISSPANSESTLSDASCSSGFGVFCSAAGVLDAIRALFRVAMSRIIDGCVGEWFRCVRGELEASEVASCVQRSVKENT
jgi:hypothetical protein